MAIASQIGIDQECTLLYLKLTAVLCLIAADKRRRRLEQSI